MYSFPNLEPVFGSVSGSNYCFLTCTQVSQGTGKVVWYSHLLKNFPQFVVIYTVKGCSIANKAEMDVFMELSCFFYGSVGVGNLISCSSAFSKSSLNIWRFLVHVLLKPYLQNFEPYFASMWDVCTCACCPWFLLICFLCMFIHLCTFSGAAFQCICRNGCPHVFPVMFNVSTQQSIFTATF